jgi:hypothetical protein
MKQREKSRIQIPRWILIHQELLLGVVAVAVVDPILSWSSNGW